jgi:hypothetical protein
MPNLELEILEAGPEGARKRKFARVFVNPASRDKEGRTFVTPKMTKTEIDQRIDFLISKLEEIREEAHRSLS